MRVCETAHRSLKLQLLHFLSKKLDFLICCGPNLPIVCPTRDASQNFFNCICSGMYSFGCVCVNYPRIWLMKIITGGVIFAKSFQESAILNWVCKTAHFKKSPFFSKLMMRINFKVVNLNSFTNKYCN